MSDPKDPTALREGEDYIIESDSGLLVFTAKYLLKRGYCCKNGCRNCPYGFRKGGFSNSNETDKKKTD